MLSKLWLNLDIRITLVGGGKLRLVKIPSLRLRKPMLNRWKKILELLKRGDAWVAAKAAFGEKEMTVRTPTAVAAIRGTTYRAKAGNDESSVLVYDGKVGVNAAKNNVSEAREEQRK